MAKRSKAAVPEISEADKFLLTLEQDMAAYANLFTAARLGMERRVAKILESAVNVDTIDPESGNTALILAAMHGFLPCVRLLIEKGKANVNQVGFHGMTALHHAAKNDAIDVLEYLLDSAKANPNIADESGHTPLMYAARAGNLKTLELLLTSAQTNPGSVVNHANMTALMCAAGQGHIGVVDYMIRRKENVQAVDKNGDTVLHYAARLGYERMVDTLLVAKMPATLTNNAGQRADDVALTSSIRLAIEASAQSE